MKLDNAKQAATLLAATWRKGGRLDALPAELRPRTPAEGYRIQALMADCVGEKVAGWKVGATGAHARKMLKARGPFCGRIFASRLLKSGAAIASEAHAMRGLEGEFAFKLAKDLKPRARPYRLAEVKAAIGSVHPAIEIIGPRWNDMLAVGVPSLIADQGANGALLVGPALRGGAKLDLRAIAVRMIVDGNVVGQGSGADVLGDPYASLLWLANHLRRSVGLQAGQIVTTGTATGLAKAPAGAKVVAEFAGRPGVSLTFT